MWTFEPIGNHSNPVFTNNALTGKTFTIEGHGKIIQISFLATEQHTELSVKVDEGEEFAINNGFCLESISDSRGLGYANIEKAGEWWRYTFTLPIIFKNKIDIYLKNKMSSHKLKDVHIYYLKWK